MPARDKYVILTLDEMSIKPNYIYNNHTQSFMGNPTIPCSQGVISKRMKEDPTWDQDEALATHAFFAMIASLCARFKCLVGVEFTDNGWCPKAVAKWMRQIIQKIYDIGLITKAIVMDMSGSNQTIQDEFSVAVTGTPDLYNPSAILNTFKVSVVPTVQNEEL